LRSGRELLPGPNGLQAGQILAEGHNRPPDILEAFGVAQGIAMLSSPGMRAQT
jgi:hypothetical protein